MDVSLFLWDQYIIGLDVPGYHSICLPAYTAVMLMLVREKMAPTQSPSAMEAVLHAESVKLTVPQFQFQMGKTILPELLAALAQADKAALPVLDPTQTKYPPWTHWHNETLPERTKAQDRREAREEREAERERLRQQEMENNQAQRDHEEAGRREEEDRFLRQAAKDRQRNEEERMSLEDQLEQERRNRIEGERAAAEEIEKLRRELDAVRGRPPPRKKSPAPSVYSVVSSFLLPPPPNTRASMSTPIQFPVQRTPSRQKTPQQQAGDAILDFLKRVSHSFNKVSHSEGPEKQELDEETKKAIDLHKEDMKAAELELFGRPLKPGEFEKLTPEEQEETSDKIMDVIRQRMEERRRQEMQGQR